MIDVEYVTGFAFSADRSRVVLIQKNRPAWQAGRWTGVGGKYELRDVWAANAMEREFREETGVYIGRLEWQRYLTIQNGLAGWRMHLYRAFTDAIKEARTVTDEKVRVWQTAHALDPWFQRAFVPDCAWLIPLALDEGTSAGTMHVRQGR